MRLKRGKKDSGGGDGGRGKGDGGRGVGGGVGSSRQRANRKVRTRGKKRKRGQIFNSLFFFPLVPSNTKKRRKRGVGAKILASDRRYSGSRLASANKVQLGYKDGRRSERQHTHSGRCGQPS